MSGKLRKKSGSSLATQLLRIVFSLYLGVVVCFMVGRVVVEYRYQKKNICKEFLEIQTTFEKVLAGQIWNLDEAALRDTVKGLIDLPVIAGVRICDENGMTIAIGGIIKDEALAGETGLHVSLSGCFPDEQAVHRGALYRFEIFYLEFPIMHPVAQEPRSLGRTTLYSNTSVILDRVKASLFLMVIETVLQIGVLWLIFRVVFIHVLRKPLSVLTDGVQRITLDNLDSIHVPRRANVRDELGVLVESFNQMIGNLRGEILKREAADASFKESEEKLNSILNVAPAGIGLIRGRVFEAVNVAMCNLTGYSSDELIGQSARIFYSTEDQFVQHGERLFSLIAQHGKGTLEVSWRRKDGRNVDVLLSAIQVISADPASDVTFVAMDITDRKAAEEAARVSAKKLALHVEQTPLGVIGWGVGGDVTEWNAAAEHIFGYTSREAIGKNLKFIVPDQGLEAIDTLWPTILKQTGGTYSTNDNITKDGRVIRCEWYNTTLVDEQGMVVGVASQVLNVTERERVERAIRSLVEVRGAQYGQPFFEALTGALAQALNAEYTLIGEYASQNPDQIRTIAVCVGGKMVENFTVGLAGTPWQGLVEGAFCAHPSGVTELFPEDALLKAWKVKGCGGIPLRDSRGVVTGVMVALFCNPVQDVGFVESILKIFSGRASAEMERLRSEKMAKRLMLAIEQSAEVVIITDANGTIQYVNKAFETVTGYRREEALGNNPRMLKSGQQPPEFYKQMWATLISGSSWSGTLFNRKKDGSQYVEEATITPVLDESGRIVNYVAAKRDVSREIMMEEQLREAQKMKAVGQMAGGMAHDFNNLLQVISGYAELTEMALTEDHELYSSIHEIAKTAMRGKVLINQLLAFSRRQIINPEDLNLNHVIDGLLNMIRGVLREHIELKFIAGPDLKTVSIDRGLMEQILVNLCVNARDAMPNGGALTLETENVVFDHDGEQENIWALQREYVLLRVTDSGMGMDAQTLEHIFEPFFTTKEVGKGTGLGLSSVFGIVKQHKGHITACSEVGCGAVFKIYLPVVDRAPIAVAPVSVALATRGTETILVAEDDEIILKLSESLLTGAGYQVITARDGVEAVRLFEERADEIDLIMLDVIMPRLGGKEAFEKINTIRPGIRHLFASGYSENAVYTNFIQTDGHALISKPYQIKDLLVKIRTILDKK